MKPQKAIETIATELLEKQGLCITTCTPLQALWAGYGHICHVTALPSSSDTNSAKPISLILKYIDPPSTASNRQPDEGHLRKVLSYQIEQYFYTHLAPHLPKDVAVAACLTSTHSPLGNSGIAMLLTDLRKPFPVAGERRGELNETQVYAALRWLARFHGFWWARTAGFDRKSLCRPPLEHFEKHRSVSLQEGGGVWLNGGYTYLATRQKELKNLAGDGSEWSSTLCKPFPGLKGGYSVAEAVAEVLAPTPDRASRSPICDFETLIHGDVKSENLFTTREGDEVAFFDFQYVGLGFGVCDLAKLFTCSIPVELLEDPARASPSGRATMGAGEKQLLQAYLSTIVQVSGKEYSWEDLERHWETSLVDWLRFQASWGFWGNTDWLESRVRSILSDEGWRTWLQGQVL